LVEILAHFFEYLLLLELQIELERTYEGFIGDWFRFRRGVFFRFLVLLLRLIGFCFGFN